MTQKIAALLCVDTSPRWLYGHTFTDERVDRDMENAVALASQRLTALMQHVASLDLPRPMAVESEQLARLRLDDLRGKGALLLCGAYGDACVLDVADRLCKRGYPVTILEDACLWSAPLETLLRESDDPRLARIPRRRAVEVFPGLLKEDRNLWAGEPPSF